MKSVPATLQYRLHTVRLDSTLYSAVVMVFHYTIQHDK